MTPLADERGVATVKGSARQSEILDAAVSIFARSGFHGATTNDVARACNISRQNLRYYFPDKTSLLMAVLQRRDDRDFAVSATVRSARELVTHLRAVSEANRDNPQLIALFALLNAEAVGRDHPAHSYFQNRYATGIALTRQMLRAVQETGGLRDGVDPDLAAVRLFALQDGLQLHWLYDERAPDVADMVEAHLREILILP